MCTVFGLSGILGGIIAEVVNGAFRMAIGVIVAILSTIAFFGSLFNPPIWQRVTSSKDGSAAGRCYEADNIFGYMVETYINDNNSCSMSSTEN